MKEKISCLGRGRVPFYDALCDYEWISDFNRAVKIKKQMMELRAKKKEIKRLSPTKSSFKEQLKKSYEEFLQRRKLYLQKFLKDVERSIDPFRRFENEPRNVDRLGPYISWGEIEQALKEYPPSSNAISDERRQKELEAIEEQFANLQADLSEVSPQTYFIFRDGKPDCDARFEFVEHWLNVQAKVCEPCCPQGFLLTLAPENEKQAYRQLKIARVLRTNARFSAHTGIYEEGTKKLILPIKRKDGSG